MSHRIWRAFLFTARTSLGVASRPVWPARLMMSSWFQDFTLSS